MHGQPVCEAELHAQINSSGDWKVVDLCISAGVDGLSKKIQEVKDFVDERVDALSRKQDDLAESQDEMKDQLEDVQQNISGVTYTCTCIMLQINLSRPSTDNGWKVSVPEDAVTCKRVHPVETALASPAVVILSSTQLRPLYNPLCRGLKGGHSWLFGLSFNPGVCLLFQSWFCIWSWSGINMFTCVSSHSLL